MCALGPCNKAQTYREGNQGVFQVGTGNSFSLRSDNLEVVGSWCSDGPLTTSNWSFSVGGSPRLCATVLGAPGPPTEPQGQTPPPATTEENRCPLPTTPLEDEETDPALQGPGNYKVQIMQVKTTPRQPQFHSPGPFPRMNTLWKKNS